MMPVGWAVGTAVPRRDATPDVISKIGIGRKAKWRYGMVPGPL
jgi:hypothetical protein